MDNGERALIGEQTLIEQLEERFRRITELLYDTRVPSQLLDEEVLPFLAEDVRFIDPWQSGGGRETYRRGAAGFHCMFSFDFDIFQLNVQMEEGNPRGRAIVDGVMNLKQLSWLYTYPLRTILVYDFTLASPSASGGDVRPLIHTHEEMWSLGDMLEAIPLLGRLYARVFRRAFSYGFLAASSVCRRVRGA
ncbi:hypothetical protein [Vitiosangium sp. GDMCC 1.1324]|uniref:hypothetical protein n=1 Tax=Vitiosangium sp. (strain GDMCC 1.1324) TaxID=2138576 RepID=UPI000D377C2E|nr:hypothetical protein [Vitiosangium sp. GDMCC 1.1324]PTL75596.1 hypothetical protein DAT35_54260 [Vitiosangium sp. GDMCC 1.1324]